MCIISNPLTVSPFNSTAANSYSFTGTCELVVLQSCSGAQSDFSVRVDFLTDTGATGAVGVFKDGLSWISRENGMVIPSSEAVQTVFVNQNATLRRNVLEVRDNIMVTVIHNYGGKITISYIVMITVKVPTQNPLKKRTASLERSL